MNGIDYRQVLNPAQLEAVTTTDGPVLVIAGAGSGKTRTLVYRVARLVEMGVPPESLLLLTFTRKAAQEMLERASSLADERCRQVSGGTFHSMALRVLRIHGEMLGFTRNFTVLDRADMEETIGSLTASLSVPKGTPRFPKRATLANILSKAANLEQPIDEFMMEEYGQFLEFIPQINQLGKLYQAYKKDHQLMDYDDLLLNLRRLLGERPDVREDLSRRHRYVMVDEYQDTNRVQADIVKWLAHEHRNIMVVGDDAQSIYSFRGADYKNMFEFSREFPEAKLIKLEENYRSTQPILSMTNAMMDQAGDKFTKCLFTGRSGGERPRVVNTRTEPEQALFICQTIQEHLQQGGSLNDFAVLFRAGYHSFELEAELTRQGIYYVKFGGFKFLESAHIKDFLAHLRVLTNREDTVSWVRILKLVENVGQAKTQAIIDWMKDNNVSPEHIDQWPGARKNDGGLKPLGRLFAELKGKKTPRRAVERVMEYYAPLLRQRFDDYQRRRSELDQLVPMASRYRKIGSFLDDLVLEPPNSSADLEPGRREESLTLSTVHSAKGLEWPVVCIIWAMEGRFPAARAYRNPAELEEERRLMYVAATRAKDQLFLSYPGEESLPLWSGDSSGWPRYGNGLCAFIRELPGDVIDHRTMGAAQRAMSEPRSFGEAAPFPEASKESTALRPGDRVNHPAFGAGVISKLMGEDKVEVLFRNAGRKLLHLEYTSLEKV